MTRSAAGEIGPVAELDDPLLAHDWYKILTPDQLAAYVRYQFIYLNERVVDWDDPAHNRRRPNWDGGRDNYGVRHTSTWTKVVRAINDSDAHPGMWVHAHFSPVAEVKIVAKTSSLPDIRPSFLYSSSSRNIYDKYVYSRPDDIRTVFDIAGYTIASRMRSAEAFNFNDDDKRFYVLCDQSYVSAPPFFRHAFAALGDCTRAIEKYLWFAALEYEAQQPAYDCVINHANNNEYDWWLTDDLRAGVRLIRQHWGTYHG